MFSGYAEVVTGCSWAAMICVGIQFLTKRLLLDVRRYHYFRDLLLIGAWLLLAIWFGSPLTRVLIGAAFCAGIIGLGETLFQNRLWILASVLLGIACAIFGPSINFIRFDDGEYIYLSPLVSLIATTLWFVVLPLVMRHLDAIPGLLGHILAVTFSLMLTTVVLTAQATPDAFFMSFAGIVLLGAFWSRFGNVYRQAGQAMSGIWGILVAGTSILGLNKGIVFSSTLFLSLGLFAIPLFEVSLYWVSMIFTEQPYGAESLYKKMIQRGIEHPDAVRLIAGLCALLSVVTALIQSPANFSAVLWWGAAGLLAMVLVVPLFLRRRSKSPMVNEKPRLWGVKIDNVSMNYALSRARGMILSPKNGAQLISTVNALAMEEALKDKVYHSVLCSSAMVLSDGVGLLWGLRFLSMPIQERVTGIDFAEQLCRMAASEGWGIYFLGASGDTAESCALALTSRYPGLIVSGARDGYFDFNDPSIAEEAAKSGAKILLAAMGIPRQEKWVAHHSEIFAKLSANDGILAVGVGGAFDVLSGRLKRAPRFMQVIGLEWLYRLCQEPHRWRRNMKLVTFVLRVLATRFKLYKWSGEYETKGKN